MFKKNQSRFNQPQFPGQMNDYMQQMPGGMPHMQGMPPMQGMPMQGMPMQGAPQGGMLPNMQFERLQFEIMENRRRLNNLAKRMARVESYLRIKDTPEYGYIEDDQKPNNFSY